jgi:hypothetical protein
MKKSVLLGIVAVVLFALPALAGEKKIEGWQGYWTWFAQPVKDFPIKMKIPWFIDITNQEGWEIQLEQVECAVLGPAYIAEWPCFRGSRDLIVAVNFNCTLLCGINKTYLAGNWGCSMNPEDIDMPGGTSTVCVKLWKPDLLSAPPGENMHVADVDIYVKPR